MNWRLICETASDVKQETEIKHPTWLPSHKTICLVTNTNICLFIIHIIFWNFPAKLHSKMTLSGRRNVVSLF